MKARLIDRRLPTTFGAINVGDKFVGVSGVFVSLKISERRGVVIDDLRECVSTEGSLIQYKEDVPVFVVDSVSEYRYI